MLRVLVIKLVVPVQLLLGRRKSEGGFSNQPAGILFLDQGLSCERVGIGIEQLEHPGECVFVRCSGFIGGKLDRSLDGFPGDPAQPADIIYRDAVVGGICSDAVRKGIDFGAVTKCIYFDAATDVIRSDAAMDVIRSDAIVRGICRDASRRYSIRAVWRHSISDVTDIIRSDAVSEPGRKLEDW